MKQNETMEAELERAYKTYADDFLVSLADRLGATAKASVVFAEPVKSDGVTVIPVAKARWGFGGGSGRKNEQQGSGGGGGVQVSPIGFIEISNRQARFHRINEISLPVIAIGALAGFLLGSLLRSSE